MLKVYDKDGTQIASTTDYAVAALVVSTFGESGGWVSDDVKSRVLWVEGEDGEAASSYDDFADFIERVRVLVPSTMFAVRNWADKSARYFVAYKHAREGAHSA